VFRLVCVSAWFVFRLVVFHLVCVPWFCVPLGLCPLVCVPWFCVPLAC
jgi:hypothetical protein